MLNHLLKVNLVPGMLEAEHIRERAHLEDAQVLQEVVTVIGNPVIYCRSVHLRTNTGRAGHRGPRCPVKVGCDDLASTHDART